MIPKDILEKFKAYYQEDYGIWLSDEEATEKATVLFNVLECVLKNDALPGSQTGANNEN